MPSQLSMLVKMLEALNYLKDAIRIKTANSTAEVFSNSTLIEKEVNHKTVRLM